MGPAFRPDVRAEARTHMFLRPHPDIIGLQSPGQACGPGPVAGQVPLPGGNAPRNFGVVERLIFGMILGHDIDVGVYGEFLYGPLNKAFRAGDISRHYKVPNDQSAARHAL